MGGGGTGPVDVGQGIASYGTTPGGLDVFGPTSFTETGSGGFDWSALGQGGSSAAGQFGRPSPVPSFSTPQFPYQSQNFPQLSSPSQITGTPPVAVAPFPKALPGPGAGQAQGINLEALLSRLLMGA